MIGVIYWSGTGNTEQMAQQVAEGAAQAGAEVSLFSSAEFGADQMDAFSAVAFGCPSMGSEQLEESEFDPMFQACRAKLNGKKIALFGSYGWGDGQWMRDWCARCEAANANIYDENGLMAHETPDGEALEACRELGRKLAAW